MFVVALALWLIMSVTDIGKAIRAVAKEKLGAQLVGIDVASCLCGDFRPRHGLRRHRRLPADSDLLRQSERRQCVRA